ncbi:hypothetical protein HPB50_014897 [Hyalomma asiaticum]|uniref:Uncharacterized protein n=1 Tax=Hyalomma asiaticum TaxID=266040 RepID=A0ACB7T8J3_HYAAI|nr:hypothetical protein HPB50_014897 [Hyalomma asiaticum]
MPASVAVPGNTGSARTPVQHPDPIGFENAVEVEIRVQDQAGSRNKKETAKEAHNQEGRKQ